MATRKRQRKVEIDSLSIPHRYPTERAALSEARRTGATHSVQVGSSRLAFRPSRYSPGSFASAAICGDDECGWRIDSWIVWHGTLPDDATPLPPANVTLRTGRIVTHRLMTTGAWEALVVGGGEMTDPEWEEYASCPRW